MSNAVEGLVRRGVSHAAKGLKAAALGLCIVAVMAGNRAAAQGVTQGTSQTAAELPASLRGVAGGGSESLPLGVSSAKAAEQGTRAPTTDGAGSYIQTVAALAGVLALIATLAWIIKRASKKRGGLWAALAPTAKAPQGVLEVLARYPVAPGTQLVVLKFDRRVLLVSQASNKGWRSGATMTTLCELSDPADVASILIKTRGEEQASLAAKFQQMLASEESAFEDPAATPVRSSMPERNPYSTPATRGVKTTRPRLDIVAGDESPSGQQTAAAIRQRLAAMQRGARKAGGGA